MPGSAIPPAVSCHTTDTKKEKDNIVHLHDTGAVYNAPLSEQLTHTHTYLVTLYLIPLLPPTTSHALSLLD